MRRREVARAQLVATVIAAAVALGIVAAPAIAEPADEERFVELINAERRAHGVGPLVVLPELVDKAREQSERMRSENRLFHSPQLGQGIDGWKLIGENVGMGGNIETLHEAFMNSPGHRDNILRASYDAVGVGVVWDGDVPFVTEIFIDSIDDLRVQYTPPFADDDGSVHEADIIALAELGITRGCDLNRYCPHRDVTREEMATMLVRAFDLTGSSGDVFTDDDASIHESAIETLAHNRITVGCGPGLFCPERSISRGEMASFLVRILDLPPSPSAGFEDTANSVHRDAIDALAGAGITYGCSDTAFCPNAHVTREQLASFLIRALEH